MPAPVVRGEGHPRPRTAPGPTRGLFLMSLLLHPIPNSSKNNYFHTLRAVTAARICYPPPSAVPTSSSCPFVALRGITKRTHPLRVPLRAVAPSRLPQSAPRRNEPKPSTPVHPPFRPFPPAPLP